MELTAGTSLPNLRTSISELKPGDSKQLQTSHIIEYKPIDLEYVQGGFQNLLSTANYTNCTKRQRGLPCDGAIPTGGQRVRLTKVKLRYQSCLVWSSWSYAEGEYEDVCNTPLFGPKHL